MNARDLVPWRRIIVETKWSPEVAAAELHKRIDERKWYDPFPPAGDAPFVGSAMPDGRFSLMRSTSYRNSFKPVIRVIIEPSHHGGSRLRILMRLHLGVALFMSVWMSGALAAGIAGLWALAHGNRAGLYFVAFPLFGALLLSLPFAFEARSAERLLREIYAQAPAVPPAPETGEAYR